MVNVMLSGGLGNQLFQLMCGLKISGNQPNKVIVCRASLDLTKSRRDFSLGEVLTDDFMSQIRVTGNDNMFGRKFSLGTRLPSSAASFFNIINDSNVNSIIAKDNCVTTGYFQNINVLPDVAVIRPLFRGFDWDLDCSTAVGIHIRRGDFLLPAHSIHGIIPFGKLLAQVDEVQHEVDCIYIFSDANIKEEFQSYLNSEKSFAHKRIFFVMDFHLPTCDEFLLMRKMRSLICSNSTFSWWAGFSSEMCSKVFLPQQWYVDQAISPGLIFDRASVY